MPRDFRDVQTIGEFYRYVFTDLADPRTESFPLIRDPLPGLAILAFYLYFVKDLGPRLMENRKPFDLRTVLIVYDMFQVLFCIYFVADMADAMRLYKFNFQCQPVDQSSSPLALRFQRLFYTYFIMKMVELIETVFFVLRKKYSQITFLHCYHHIMMIMVSWGATKYFPGGHGAVLGLLNCIVHAIMYTYYLLASLGVENRTYRSFKKGVTMIQMGQFLFDFVYFSQLWFIDCDYPSWIAFLITPQTLFFFYLFHDFYVKAYLKRATVLKVNSEETVKASIGTPRRRQLSGFEDKRL